MADLLYSDKMILYQSLELIRERVVFMTSMNYLIEYWQYDGEIVIWFFCNIWLNGWVYCAQTILGTSFPPNEKAIILGGIFSCE